MPVNPYKKYKEQSVMTMTRGEMLLKLYDEIIKELNGGIICIGEKDYQKTNKCLQKAQRIINHLNSTLNFKYDVANNLSALYDFFNRQIVKANIQKDPNLIREVIPMIEELRDAFAEAERRARVQ